MAKSFPNTGATVGLAADRTAMTSMVEGQEFFETDTNKMFVYSGSGWVETNTWGTTSGVTGVNNLIVPPMVSATRTAAQTISNATWTFISLTSEVFDTNNMFTATDTKITIQTSGVYSLSGQCGYTPGNFDVLFVVEKNAASALAGTMLLASFIRGITISDTNTSMAGIFNLTAADTIHLTTYQNSGGNLNTSPNPKPTLSAHLIGRTS